MSAEVLRRAASEMRRDSINGQTEDSAFLESVAVWLDACALVCEVSATAVKAHAIAVARAYLGES